MADPVIDATDITLGPGTTGGTYTGGAPDTGSTSMFDGFSPTPKGAKAMQDAQRDKLRDDTAASDKADAGMARHQAQMEHARAAEEYSIGSLPPPWDAKKEEADRIRGPFEAFGSPATIFAMAASAFTKRPMVNALNAGAAAMTAIHDHDEKSYTRAYAAWKDNTQLALDRFKMEHEAFRDSETLFNTDQIRWRQKATENALRFNDKTSLALMEQGLYQQYFEAQAAKAKASEAMMQEKTRIMQWEANRQTSSALMQQAEKEHPIQKPGEEPKEGSWTPTQHVQYRSLVLADVMNPDKKTDEGILAQGEREHFNRTSKLMSAEEKADLLQRMHSRYSSSGHGAGSAPLTSDRDIQDEVNRQKTIWRAEGIPETEVAKRGEDYRRELKARGATVTGNRKDQLTGLAQRADTSVQTIDKMEALLKKHNALTGLGGRITRPAEVISNIFGSDETDRKEFVGLLATLREWTPRLLNESLSRPLAAEAANITEIAPGLAAGDTTANVARRLNDLRVLLQKFGQQWRQRAAGSPTEGDAPATETPAPTAAPPVQPFWNADKPVSR